jgi:hypothetical protein
MRSVTARWSTAAGSACLIVLIACSSNKAATSYPSAAQLARALNTNGVACTGYARAPNGGPATVGAAGPLKKGARPLFLQAGTCSHGKGKLLLFTFKNSALRDHWLPLGRLYGSLVVGPNWSVSTQDRNTADDIKSAIGGELR